MADCPARQTVAIVTSPFLGHFYPTLELAHALTEAGIAVVYLLTATVHQINEEITNEGLESEDISGLLQINQLNILMKRARLRSARFLLQHQIKEFRGLATARDIALVLVDNFMRYVGALATFNHIPVVSLCLNYSENVYVSDPVRARDYCDDRRRGKMGFITLLKHWSKNPGLLLDRVIGVQKDVERFAAKRNLETDNFIYNCIRLFRYPCLYAAPEELLRPHEKRGIYLGLCSSRKRHKTRNLDQLRAKDIPILYVSLGTLSHEYTGAREFFINIARAFANERHLHLIVHIGGRIHRDELGPLPSNIEIHQHLSQAEIIEISSLVITHGGLGTVKQCIYFGKPMLVFPLMTEQLDNGIRVVSHGLGLMGDITKTSPGEINGLAMRILEDDSFAARVRNLRKEIGREDYMARGVTFLRDVMRNSNHLSST